MNQLKQFYTCYIWKRFIFFPLQVSSTLYKQKSLNHLFLIYDQFRYFLCIGRCQDFSNYIHKSEIIYCCYFNKLHYDNCITEESFSSNQPRALIPVNLHISSALIWIFLSPGSKVKVTQFMSLENESDLTMLNSTSHVRHLELDG